MIEILNLWYLIWEIQSNFCCGVGDHYWCFFALCRNFWTVDGLIGNILSIFLTLFLLNILYFPSMLLYLLLHTVCGTGGVGIIILLYTVLFTPNLTTLPSIIFYLNPPKVDKVSLFKGTFFIGQKHWLSYLPYHHFSKYLQYWGIFPCSVEELENIKVKL